jgi:hypothetical protein
MKRPNLLFALLLLISASACTSNVPGESASVSAVQFDEVVTREAVLDMEEHPGALLVIPAVALDSRGGFIVADRREAQVRRYDEGGRLLWLTGRKGGGPGEFYVPSHAIRLPGGEILVIDRNGALTTFDSTGSQVLKTVSTDILAGDDLRLVNDSVVLIAGRIEGDRNSPRLHLWNLASEQVVSSFFSPFEGAVNPHIAHAVGWSSVSLRGDTLAATFSTSDTIYLHTVDGRLVSKIPLPSGYFRNGRVEVPSRRSTDPLEQARVISQIDLVERVDWLHDGTFVVQYQSVVPGTAFERVRHLIHMSRKGRAIFETREVPRLLAVDQGSSTLYFVDSEAEVPNRWVVSRLR